MKLSKVPLDMLFVVVAEGKAQIFTGMRHDGKHHSCQRVLVDGNQMVTSCAITVFSDSFANDEVYPLE